LLRVSASQYDEIIYQQVLPGNAVCHDLALLQLVLTALWQILRNCAGGGGGGTTATKTRIILRLDGGFGTVAIVNYLLAEGYQVVVKQFNGLRSQKRASELAEADWHSESEVLVTGKAKVEPTTSENGREFALLEDDGFYELGERKLWQIAVRCPTKPKSQKAKAAPKTAKRKVKAEVVEAEPKAKYAYTMLLVARRELGELEAVQVPAVLAAQLEFYDGRAVIESASFRGDKQGLGLAKRRKHSLSGQEFLVLLAQLAHNLVSWAKNWLGAGDEWCATS
jgi:hypothetical protein